MVTRLWLFPNGQPIDLDNLDAQIDKLKGLSTEQTLPAGLHTIPVSGMVDQLNEYTVFVGDEGTLLILSPSAGYIGQTNRYLLPHMAPSVPIMSSKGPEDPNMYIFALLEVTRS
jgi:hypothetical protein